MVRQSQPSSSLRKDWRVTTPCRSNRMFARAAANSSSLRWIPSNAIRLVADHVASRGASERRSFTRLANSLRRRRFAPTIGRRAGYAKGLAAATDLVAIACAAFQESQVTSPRRANSAKLSGKLAPLAPANEISMSDVLTTPSLAMNAYTSRNDASNIEMSDSVAATTASFESATRPSRANTNATLSVESPPANTQ